MIKRRDSAIFNHSMGCLLWISVYEMTRVIDQRIENRSDSGNDFISHGKRMCDLPS